MVTTAAVSLAIPDSQKDKDWHKSYHDYILGTTTFDAASLHDIVYAFDYYHGFINAGRDHNHVITSENGVQYPIDFINYNEIVGFVDPTCGGR